MKLLHVVGNRPQFIKLAPFLRETKKHADVSNVIVHSGQHYDYEMSKVFFDELGIPTPDYNLGVGAGTHGEQTGRVLSALDEIIIKENPDRVVVYGDTNTTLAAALAGHKLNYPVCHVESGLREKVWRPEEINRKLSDHCSQYLFCPTKIAVQCLKEEGVEEDRVFLTGDITYDAFLWSCEKLKKEARLGTSGSGYVLITMHRGETVDHEDILSDIVETITSLNDKVVFPAHPRTMKYLEQYGLLEKLVVADNVELMKPVGYFEFLELLLGSKLVITDSGGVIKESFYAGKKCVTLDFTTEYHEIFSSGTHVLAGKDASGINKTINDLMGAEITPLYTAPEVFGNGDAARKMLTALMEDK
jgi:UDP-GlcNAc3NAcA epimerase